METVLLYRIKDTDLASKLKPVLLKLRIRVKTVAPADYLQPIGSLLGLKGCEPSDEPCTAQEFTEPMMVMSGFTGARLDLFLREMKSHGVPSIPLKAIVTAHNQTWTSLHLYEELKAEHDAMHRR